MKDLVATPSQTVGPFFHYSLTVNPALACMAGARGERIRLAVRVFDGDGAPVPDAMVELWQADADGKYEHPEDPQDKTPDAALCGFGRAPTGDGGECVFETVRPGRVLAQAPHINVIVLARGVLAPLFTRIYFVGNPANAEDYVLGLVPAERRETLMARPEKEGTWRFDIYLSGDRETVFFDL